MSRESVERITGKIVLDASFRETLLANPDRALSHFELTESEKASIKRLDCETMEAVAQTLAVRLSRIRQVSPDVPFYLVINKEDHK